MRSTYFLSTLLLWAVSVSGHAMVSLPPRDSVDILINLGEIKLNHDPSAAIPLMNRAVEYSRNEGYQEGLAKSLHLRARAEARKHIMKDALRDLEEAARVYENVGDEVGQGLCINGMAVVHSRLDRFPEALHYVNIAEQILANDSANLANVLNVKGVLYLQTKDYQRALETFLLAHKLIQKDVDTGWLCTILNNIALSYGHLGDFQSSIDYYKQSLDVARGLNDPIAISHGLINLAGVYLEKNAIDKAKPLLTEGINIARTNAVYNNLGRGLLELSRASNTIGEREQYALEGLQVLEEHNEKTLLPIAYSRVGDLYHEIGQTNKAIEYERKSNALKDSMLLEERRAVAELKNNNSTAETGSDDGLWVMVALGFVIVIPVVVWLSRKKKRKGEEIEVVEEAPVVEPAAIDKKEIQSIEVVNGGGLKMLLIEDLVYIEKENKSYFAVANDQRYRIGLTISHIEDFLPRHFFRVNRQVIINTRFMNNYSFWENHKYIIRMNDEKKTEFTISRARLKELKSAFGEKEVQ